MANRRLSRRHIAAGALFFVAVPLSSWLLDGGNLAYTMYARTFLYRLEIVGRDHRGLTHTIMPYRLAARTDEGAAAMLAGAEHEQRTVRLGPLRAHLDDLAKVACTAELAAVDVTLHERSDDANATEKVHLGHAECTP
jgi:hypothetical protein